MAPVQSALVFAGEAPHRAPLVLGWPARAPAPATPGAASAPLRAAGLPARCPHTGAGVVGRTAALGETQNLEHTHGTVERHRHHVARPHGAARRIDALAVDAHMTGCGERGGRLARAHHPRVPQPFVDALAIQGCGAPVKCSPGLARLLGARLELLLERRELGERRIRIGRPVAAVPALAAPLDVFRAQIRIALRTIATRSRSGRSPRCGRFQPLRRSPRSGRSGRRARSGRSARCRRSAPSLPSGRPWRPWRRRPLAARSGLRRMSAMRSTTAAAGALAPSAPTAAAASEAAAASGGACVCRCGRRWRGRVRGGGLRGCSSRRPGRQTSIISSAAGSAVAATSPSLAPVPMAPTATAPAVHPRHRRRLGLVGSARAGDSGAAIVARLSRRASALPQSRRFIGS